MDWMDGWVPGSFLHKKPTLSVSAQCKHIFVHNIVLDQNWLSIDLRIVAMREVVFFNFKILNFKDNYLIMRVRQWIVL